jgi:DNA polymerase-3 subunit epsilon
MKMDFVAIDFETACYSPKNACSIGMVKYHKGKKVDTFYSLIHPPELRILPNCNDIHGLTEDDVKKAPVFPGLWESKILPFIDGLPLAAHNAILDMGMLFSTLEWYELSCPFPWLRYFCSLQLARSVWPSMKSHTLTRLMKAFHIAYYAQNALDVAEACGKIVIMAAEKHHSTILKDLLSAAEVDMKQINGRGCLTDKEIGILLGGDFESECPLTKNEIPLGTIGINNEFFIT